MCIRDSITSTSSPRFYFVNQTFFSVSTPLADVVTKINDLLNSGYYVIARVKNSGHFVPVSYTHLVMRPKESNASLERSEL